jgi:hypothetical protein
MRKIRSTGLPDRARLKRQRRPGSKTPKKPTQEVSKMKVKVAISLGISADEGEALTEEDMKNVAVEVIGIDGESTKLTVTNGHAVFEVESGSTVTIE